MIDSAYYFLRGIMGYDGVLYVEGVEYVLNFIYTILAEYLRELI